MGNSRESQIDNVNVCRWLILDISMEMGSAQDRRIIEGHSERLVRVFLDLALRGWFPHQTAASSYNFVLTDLSVFYISLFRVEVRSLWLGF
jgi:hypothetical protein